MAKEIQCVHTTAKTVYAQIFNATGSVWNGTSFEAYATANIANYDIALTEQGTASGIYMGDFPSLSAGLYNVIARERAGGSPAEADVAIGVGIHHWDGSALIPRGRLSTSGADDLLDRSAGIETNRTLRQGLRLILAALCGKLSGAATTSIAIRDTNDTKDRIAATVDSDGNRSAVTLDGT